VLNEDYVRTARAKGLSPFRVIGLHALRNAMIPVITAIGLMVGMLLAGLGFAPVFPSLMHETPKRFTAEAAPVVIGRQVGGAYLGGAVLPLLLGWIMAHTMLETLAPMVIIAILGMLFMVGRLNKMS